MGVTGARATTSDLAGPLVERTRAVTDLPIGVGLGVSNGDQAAEVASYADGVIVGSAFVRVLLDADDTAERAQGAGRAHRGPRLGRTPWLGRSLRPLLVALVLAGLRLVGVRTHPSRASRPPTTTATTASSWTSRTPSRT